MGLDSGGLLSKFTILRLGITVSVIKDMRPLTVYGNGVSGSSVVSYSKTQFGPPSGTISWSHKDWLRNRRSLNAGSVHRVFKLVEFKFVVCQMCYFFGDLWCDLHMGDKGEFI